MVRAASVLTMGHGPGRWRGRPAMARWAAVNGRRGDGGQAGPWCLTMLAPDRVNDGEALVLSLEAEEASRCGTCGRDEQEGRRGRPAGNVHRRDYGEGGARRRRGKRDGGRGRLGAGACSCEQTQRVTEFREERQREETEGKGKGQGTASWFGRQRQQAQVCSGGAGSWR